MVNIFEEISLYTVTKKKKKIKETVECTDHHIASSVFPASKIMIIQHRLKNNLVTEKGKEQETLLLIYHWITEEYIPKDQYVLTQYL